MRLFQFGLAAGLLVAAPAFAQAPAPAQIGEHGASMSRTDTASATVESIDMRTRQVVLRGDDGSMETIVAGPEVRRLAEIRPGDRVVLEFSEAVAVSLANPADGAPPVGGGEAAARAPARMAPGAAVAQGIRARVTVNSVDSRTGTVTFTGPNGIQRKARPRQPEMLEFARTLRPGQQVDIVYGRSVAIRVEPRR